MKTNNYIFFTSLLLTMLIFGVGFMMSYGLDFMRLDEVFGIMQGHELTGQSYVVQQEFIDSFGGDKCNIMSEDMTAKEWGKLATLVAQELNKKEVKGVIVTHGTDVLHFTSAALSFMLKDLNKPVAVVGGQRSSDRGSFDGAQNLICAVHYCLSDIAEVAILMHKSSEDDCCLAIRGAKARKMHSSRRDAFRPINDLPFAEIKPDGDIKILNSNYNKRKETKVNSNSKIELNVALVKYVPG